MKIAIDLRSLHTGSISGVENYILNVVEYLLTHDKQNTYTLFYNSFKPVDVEHFHFINSRVVKTRFPNRLLNASLSVFNYPGLEKLIGDFDCLFLPNFNPFALAPGKKLAVTVHDISPVVTPEFYSTKDRVWHKILRIKRTLLRADIIFAVSNFTKQDLVREFGIPESKIRVIYPGLDHSIFNPNLDPNIKRQIRNHYELPKEYALFVNTLEPRKNLEGLINAFEQVKRPMHLVIAGKPGSAYGRIRKLINHSSKKRYIHYLGYVEEPDKPYLIALSRMLVYPSFYEGFGFQPLEAMSLGVPVVATQVTSLPEIVKDAGLLVNPYNVSDIAQALELAAESDTLRQDLIARGQERVKAFNWQTTSESILSGFQSLQTTP